MKETCYCNQLMGAPKDRKVYVHLYGCPQDGSRGEYARLPWYKKLLTTNPKKLYLEHFPKF